jgi:hypothetical protein
MVGRLTEFDDTTCTVWATIQPDQSCNFENEITIKSLQYTVSLLDLVVPDISATFCEARYNIIFQEMHSHKYWMQCTTFLTPKQLVEILKTKPLTISLMKGINDSTMNFAIGLLGATWFGDRLAVSFTGTYIESINKTHVRIEIWSSGDPVIIAIKKYFENFLNELTNDEVIVVR